MSARKLSLYLLVLVIPLFWIIKPVQMFFEAGIDGGTTYKIGIGLLRRSDDPSLWSFAAAFVASLAIYWATKAPDGRAAVRCTLTSWLVTIFVYVFAALIYTLNVRDHRGTFFWGADRGALTADHMVVEDLQDFEGFISVLAMLVPYFYLGLAVQMLCEHWNRKKSSGPPNAHLVALAGLLPFYTVAAYVVWYGMLVALSATSPDVENAIDTFKIQKLPAVIATQLLFWLPLIAVGATAAYRWRGAIRWEFREIGPLPIILWPTAAAVATAPNAAINSPKM